MKEINTDEVANRLENQEKLNLIDVREDDEVANGMIPTAKHIPLGSLPERLNEFDSSREYIIICRSGGRSRRAQEFLINNGINAINMTGGMLDWDGETK